MNDLPVQVKNRATVAAEALEQAQALREALAASITPDADAGQRQHLQTVEREISRCDAVEPATVETTPPVSSVSGACSVRVVSSPTAMQQCCERHPHRSMCRLQSEITAEHQKFEHWRQENVRRRCVADTCHHRHTVVTMHGVRSRPLRTFCANAGGTTYHSSSRCCRCWCACGTQLAHSPMLSFCRQFLQLS
jgi:hypothetical protein